MNSQRTLGAASLLVLSLAILGCAPPFLASELQVLTDLQAPSVQVTSPANGSTFQSIVTITGQIRDLDATGTIRASVATEFISEASYSVRDTELAAVIEIGEDGIFSFSFPSASFDKKIAVDIVAVDTNGNSSSFTLELVPDEAGPYLDVISPDDYTYYATLIELAGVVANTSAMESVSEVDTLEYRVLGTSLSGPLSFDDAGAYNTIIDSSTLTDNIVIEVKATK